MMEPNGQYPIRSSRGPLLQRGADAAEPLRTTPPREVGNLAYFGAFADSNLQGQEAASEWRPQKKIRDLAEMVTRGERVLHAGRGPYLWYDAFDGYRSTSEKRSVSLV
jgi:hypothetical protein